MNKVLFFSSSGLMWITRSSEGSKLEKNHELLLLITSLKDQYGPRVFFLEFPFSAENMIIRSIIKLWWHSEILKLILGVVRGMFTKRLKGTRRLLYTVKSDFFEMTALHS